MVNLLSSIRNNKWLFFATVVLFILLFIDIPFEDKSRSLNALWNLGHIVCFALFARFFFVSSSFFNSKSFYLRLVLCVFSAALVGMLVELLQYGLARNMDMGDVFRDVIGALVGFFFSPVIMNKVRKVAVRFGLILVLVYQLVPLANALIDEQRVRSDFPVLSSFESGFDVSRWRGKAITGISDEQAIFGEKSLRVDTDKGSYSGISLVYFPPDWSSYRTLAMELYTDDDDLEVTVRVHDRQHLLGEQIYSDRFNRQFKLEKGWNSITIDLQAIEHAPATRKLKLSDVQGMGLFVTRQSRVRVLYLDEVKLL